MNLESDRWSGISKKLVPNELKALPRKLHEDDLLQSYQSVETLKLDQQVKNFNENFGA